MLPMRPELLKGHLDALLLAVLEPGPQHGYAVIEALRVGSNGALDLPTGTVYPALHRLERAGLIASDWQTVGGRRRRSYHLTPAGTPPSARNAPCGTSSPPLSPDSSRAGSADRRPSVAPWLG